jgi:hypothetical protein
VLSRSRDGVTNETVFKNPLTTAYLSAVAEEDVWLAVFEGAAKMAV